jgi:hypothetical protein
MQLKYIASLLLLSLIGSLSYCQLLPFELGIRNSYSNLVNENTLITEQNEDFLISGTYNNPGKKNSVYLVKKNKAGIVRFAYAYENKDFTITGTSSCRGKNNYFLGGTISSSMPEKNQPVIIVSTDLNGTLNWARTYNSSGICHVTEILNQTDSTFLVIGNNWQEGIQNSRQLFVLQINIKGDLMKSFCITRNKFDALFGGCISKSGSIYLTGTCENKIGTSSDILLVKLNKDLTLLYSKEFGMKQTEAGLCIDVTENEEVYIGGIENAFGIGAMDGFILNTNADGSKKWMKAYGTKNNEKFSGIKVSLDKEISVFGTSFGQQGLSLNDDVLFMKTNETGDILNARLLGSLRPDLCFGFSLLNSGGYYIASETKEINENDSEIYVIRTDSSGSSTGCYQGEIGLLVNNLEPEESTILFYPGTSFISSNLNLSTLVINPKDNSVCVNISTISTGEKYTAEVSPNPVRNFAYLKLIGFEEVTPIFAVFNAVGMPVNIPQIEKKSPGNYKLDFSDQPEGVYELRISNNKTTIYKKINVVHSF